MKTNQLTLLILVLGLALLAWSPWMPAGRAAAAAEEAFDRAWEGVVDGCGLDCEGCGARPVAKVPFGYVVQLEYACGMIPADLPEYHERATLLVSMLGTVHGIVGP
jgi:hypothetical protein